MKTCQPSMLIAGLAALALPASAQNAIDICPSAMTADCLSEFADIVIANQTDEASRAALVLLYDEATQARIARENFVSGSTAPDPSDWRALRRAGTAAARNGQIDLAHDRYWAAAQVRANDPNERVKVLDILLIAENAANIDDPALARAVHELAAEHLPGELAGFVPLAEEIRLARLMALYGWPEASYPFLEAVYPRLSEMPADSQTYGYTLTRLIEIFILVGREDLHAQAEADLARYLQIANPDHRTAVQGDHVASLARAGLVDAALEQAKAYDIDFSESMRNVSHFFLQHGSEYYPGIPEDVLRRFERMLAAIDAPDIRGKFLNDLASQMLQDKEFDEMEDLLALVQDPTTRSELVLQLMTYHARDREDPTTAADLFYSEQVSLTPRFAQMGTFLQRYPLSLTASGLLDAGDIERGGELADIVLELWSDDQSDDRRLDAILVGALARADQQDRINMWAAASSDPSHQFSVAIEAATARALAGLSVDRNDVSATAGRLLPLISDVSPPAPLWWKSNSPYPSPRSDAVVALRRLDVAIIQGLAEHGSLDQARQAFAEIQQSPPYPYQAQLALADAETTAGLPDAAHSQRLAVMDMVLAGQIDSTEMPDIILSLHP